MNIISKKYIALLMLMIFVFANTGLAINMHYCKGALEYASVKFSVMPALEEGEDCCKKEVDHCSMEEGIYDEKSCCDDKTIKQDRAEQLVITKSNLVPTFLPIVFFSFMPPIYTLGTIDIKHRFIDFYCESHAPPLYVLYHRYILYA